MHLRSSRWLSALVALAYTLGWLLLFGHYVEEQHSICAEHGMAHHVEDVGHDDHDVDAPGLHAASDAEHEHCSFTESLRTPYPFTPCSPVEVRASIDARFAENLSFASHTVATSDVWRYAPKTSPPTPAT